MATEKYLCHSCFHEITNPICPACFLREVAAWMDEKEVDVTKKQRVLEELGRVVANAADELAETDCILCGSPHVNVCMYCLVWKTERLLKKHLTQKPVIEDFKEIFNYNIWLH